MRRLHFGVLALLAVFSACKKPAEARIEFRNDEYYQSRLFEDRREVVAFCSACGAAVKPGVVACEACASHVNVRWPETVACGFCKGTGACPTCERYGAQGECRFCRDKAPDSQKNCPDCAGSLKCHACSGTIKDGFCRGTGSIRVTGEP